MFKSKVKLLILTQKVDYTDDNLGFFHDQINEFARKCEKVTVICLKKGEHKLPKNVKIISLGKEEDGGRFKYIFNFYKYIWQERKNYNSVFVHMNPEYIVMGGLIWRVMKKKIGIWFTHKSVNINLRIAEKLSDIIFTASKESFRIKSKKVKVLGHGIDTDKFQIINRESQNINNKYFKILTVGRISPSKDYETLIRAAEIFKKEIANFKIKIIGGPGLKEHEEYLDSLKNIVKEKQLENNIEFFGSVPGNKTTEHYREADLFVHMSQTGSLDKVALEAMASELPVVSCNDAVVNDVLSDYREVLSYKEQDYNELARRMKNIHKLSNGGREKMGRDLRELVIRDHSLDSLIGKIIKNLEN